MSGMGSRRARFKAASASSMPAAGDFHLRALSRKIVSGALCRSSAGRGSSSLPASDAGLSDGIPTTEPVVSRRVPGRSGRRPERVQRAATQSRLRERRADPPGRIGLVRNIHGLAGDLGEVAPHFHQPLRAQSPIIKCAHAVQDRVALSCCPGLSLELLRRKYFPTEPELAGRDDVLLNEEAVFGAPEQSVVRSAIGWENQGDNQERAGASA